jgi:DNA-binding NarL/FixJ family response regulator
LLKEEPLSTLVAESEQRLEHWTGAPRLAIVSRSPLLREAVSQRLALLGAAIAAAADFQALARLLEGERPALVLLDGDGWEEPWDQALRGLQLRRRGIPVLLLIASLGLEQLRDASSLGIATVMLKPFKPEEHTARIHDLLLGTRALTARRAHPRYVSAEGPRLQLEVLPEGDWVARRLRLLDVSAGGARMELPDPPAAARLLPGSRWAVASLVVGGARASVAFRVVHRSGRSIGVAFEQLVDRGGAFRDALQVFARQVFGFVPPRRSW